MGNGDEIDRLLAEFQTNQSDDSLESMLQEVKEEVTHNQTRNLPAKKDSIETQGINNLLNKLKADLTTKQVAQENTTFSFPQIQSPPQAHVNLDGLLNQIKAESQKPEKIDLGQQNQQNIAEIQQRELNTQKQKRLNLQQAEAWLKNIDPRSEEWLWFEQFAYDYELKVEAAIEYLKALGKLR
jgi:hypothetical protein